MPRRSPPVKYIYALVDPRDKLVRYVGRTQDPWSRFSGHLHGCPRQDNRRRHLWTKRLSRLGLSPRFIILQVCDHLRAPAAEAKWIRRFQMRRELFNGPARVRASYNSYPGYWR